MRNTRLAAISRLASAAVLALALALTLAAAPTRAQSQPATSADLAKLRAEVKEDIAGIKQDIADLRVDLAQFKHNVDARLVKVETQLEAVHELGRDNRDQYRWVMLLLAGLIASVIIQNWRERRPAPAGGQADLDALVKAVAAELAKQGWQQPKPA